MNKKRVIIIIAAIVVVISAAVAYLMLRPATNKPTQTNQSNQQENTQQSQEQSNQTQPQKGTYANYDTKAVEATQHRKLLFFHAAWCPQCRALEKSILDGAIPKDVTIFKVNYDTATDLRQKYGVTLQTTIVEVDDQGKEVKKFVAYDTPTLQAVIDAFGLK